ncbi:phosphoglucosamine mutase [Bacteriovoracaceae bacterium]|nr:phosphoglucosamine mutase [Bacteriovoracaceae bacterium]
MSGRKLFGTDGIRGKANVYPMTGEVAMALGRAVASYFQSNSKKRPLIIIGKDTRRSCYMLEQAIAAGVLSQGGRAIFTGPLPTPGVAFVTTSMRADAGIMISASHNNFEDNGIKIFDRNGHKLPDEVELELESLILNPELLSARVGAELGSAKRLDESVGRYIVQTKNTLARDISLEGMRVVLDCANGAAYKIAPMIFQELGAEVIALGVQPNGLNINQECGALHPEHCAENVVKYRADLGICLDGDADRLIVVDEKGQVVGGDNLLGVLAKLLLKKNELIEGDEIVGTIMTNLGLENYIKKLGLKFYRSKVGDRYIIERMRSKGSSFGGEPSGHLIFHAYSTTGDGLLAALKVIEAIKFFKKNISELSQEVKLYPQYLKNVNVSKKIPFNEVKAINDALGSAKKELGDKGRVVLRYSGTEPLARVMIEGENETLVLKLVDSLVEVVKKSLA